jgi:hypothetical protein
MLLEWVTSVEWRNAGQRFLQPGERAVESAPMFDVTHVERFGALHGKHVAGVVEILPGLDAALPRARHMDPQANSTRDSTQRDAWRCGATISKG